MGKMCSGCDAYMESVLDWAKGHSRTGLSGPGSTTNCSESTTHNNITIQISCPERIRKYLKNLNIIVAIIFVECDVKCWNLVKSLVDEFTSEGLSLILLGFSYVICKMLDNDLQE
jgi:hypothetical protein